MTNEHDHSETESTDDSRFIFRGGVLALDFVNTRVMVRGKPHDLLETPEDLKQWWDDVRRRAADPAIGIPELPRMYKGETYFDEELLAEAKRLRDTMRRLFMSVIEGTPREADDRNWLNEVLQWSKPSVYWQQDQQPQIVYIQDIKGVEVMLAVALSAMHLLTESDLSRLHKCHHDRCILLFYDTTKSATRQWCSKGCFERERSSRRYAEKKQAGEG